MRVSWPIWTTKSACDDARSCPETARRIWITRSDCTLQTLQCIEYRTGIGHRPVVCHTLCTPRPCRPHRFRRGLVKSRFRWSLFGTWPQLVFEEIALLGPAKGMEPDFTRLMLKASGSVQQNQSHISRHAAFFIAWDFVTAIMELRTGLGILRVSDITGQSLPALLVRVENDLQWRAIGLLSHEDGQNARGELEAESFAHTESSLTSKPIRTKRIMLPVVS